MNRIAKKIAGFVITTTLFVSVYGQTIQPPFVQEAWTKDYEPFRIAGNLYYVGTYDLASYLIVTPTGNILINTGLAESVPLIKAHVEKLGFSFGDIKILLGTHAHFDHVAGMASIRKMTGATMMINRRDAAVLADGGNSDFNFGGKTSFEPVKADRLLEDHDTITLGGTKIIVLAHPGHTRGATSFLVNAKDDRTTYRVLIANMPTILDNTKLSGMPAYPEVGRDYAATFAAMKNAQFDLWVASHASQFDLHKKHKPGDAYNPQVFADQAGYDAELAELYAEYQRRVATEK